MSLDDHFVETDERKYSRVNLMERTKPQKILNSTPAIDEEPNCLIKIFTHSMLRVCKEFIFLGMYTVVYFHHEYHIGRVNYI